MDRIAALNEILPTIPRTPSRAMALPWSTQSKATLTAALAEFSILIEDYPDYTAGYFMAAQTLVKAERTEDAKKMLDNGIASARRREIFIRSREDGSDVEN